jgi:hypothetical protein
MINGRKTVRLPRKEVLDEVKMKSPFIGKHWLFETINVLPKCRVI